LAFVHENYYVLNGHWKILLYQMQMELMDWHRLFFWSWIFLEKGCNSVYIMAVGPIHVCYQIYESFPAPSEHGVPPLLLLLSAFCASIHCSKLCFKIITTTGAY
jgi:hypothetical protein